LNDTVSVTLIDAGCSEAAEDRCLKQRVLDQGLSLSATYVNRLVMSESVWLELIHCRRKRPFLKYAQCKASNRIVCSTGRCLMCTLGAVQYRSRCIMSPSVLIPFCVSCCNRFHTEVYRHSLLCYSS